MATQKSQSQSRNTLIYKYNVLVNGRHVDNNLLGWRAALAHARAKSGNLFETNKVEILNLTTGEIITLEEAERMAKVYAQRLKGRSH